VDRDKVPEAAAVGKALGVPRVPLTAAVRHNPVVLGLEELEVAAGTPVAAAAAAVGSVAVVVERMTTLVALMPEAAEVDLHMQTRL
jgi:hypothetical protein